MIEKILLNWDIGDVTSIEKVDSFSNSVNIITSHENKKYVLKEQASYERIKNEVALLPYLREEIPIAVPIIARDDSYFIDYENRYYILYQFLDGKCFEDHYGENSREKAELLGEAIGNLHSVLTKVEYEGCTIFNLVSDVIDCSINIIEKNKAYFDYQFILEIIRLFKRYFVPSYDLLPKHIIHRDFHPGNILFKDNKLSGIVDFELSVKGVRIFDPCYCATSILVGDFNDEDKRKQWIDIFTAIIAVYNQKNKLTREEIYALTYVLYSIQLIFMAFSCNIDHIEVAKCNEKVLKWLYQNRDMIEKLLRRSYNK